MDWKLRKLKGHDVYYTMISSSFSFPPPFPPFSRLFPPFPTISYSPTSFLFSLLNPFYFFSHHFSIHPHFHLSIHPSQLSGISSSSISSYTSLSNKLSLLPHLSSSPPLISPSTSTSHRQCPPLLYPFTRLFSFFSCLIHCVFSEFRSLFFPPITLLFPPINPLFPPITLLFPPITLLFPPINSLFPPKPHCHVRLAFPLQFQILHPFILHYILNSCH
jgi:hypothetical protein